MEWALSLPAGGPQGSGAASRQVAGVGGGVPTLADSRLVTRPVLGQGESEPEDRSLPFASSQDPESRSG